ncbi:MAG TPA: 30S ribosomal protein S12 methylthiotransferase RimO [Planctomycetota bacterium]|nr:30S ribosomal protein S12 methylthiotransferase RimO [Planctomycetota bacterium]
MKHEQHTLCWVSLGCPKNLIDTERVLGRLVERGWLICERPEEAEIIVVNTCGFIQDAATESKRVLAELAELKKNGCTGVIAAGCLVERLGNSLSAELPEIDAFVGIPTADDIEAACRDLLRGRGRLFTRKPRVYEKDTSRLRITPRHYAYLQVTDGCNNRCSYCVIPLIRGALRSKPFDDVIEEARELIADGALELNVIGQDTTSYGADAPGTPGLATLLRTLGELDVHWLRLLYTHPAHFTDDLIDEVAANDKILKYIDLPIQHINDDILRRMNRREGREHVERLIDRIRERIPGVVIRTSVIVGLPGETEAAFDELVEFIEKARFERLGAFTYSHEDGVPAYDFPDQVPEHVKDARLDIIMRRQRKIAAEFAHSMIGRTLEVIVEGKSKTNRRLWEGRTWADAPDVDGIVLLSGKNIKPGTFAQARITGSRDYDLTGEIVE